MANRANLRFAPYPQHPARGLANHGDTQGGTRNHNHPVGDSYSSAPQKVYFQQGSQAPIFNGPITGGVTQYASGRDGI